MDKEQVLQNFGLTKAEVNLYITLLKIGEGTASELAHKTNTNRTFAYDRLKKLVGSGLVSYVVKDNKKYFKAANPSQILAILKEKEEQIKNILPELKKLRIDEVAGPKIEIFSSKKGIRTVLNLVFKDKKEVLIHGSINKFKDSMKEYYDIWNQRRINEKIKVKVLTNEDIELVKKGMKFTEETVEKKNPNLLILDELNLAAHCKLVPIDEIIAWLIRLKEKNPNMTIVITGRHAPEKLLEVADYANIIEVKKIPKKFSTTKGIQW